MTGRKGVAAALASACGRWAAHVSPQDGLRVTYLASHRIDVDSKCTASSAGLINAGAPAAARIYDVAITLPLHYTVQQVLVTSREGVRATTQSATVRERTQQCDSDSNNSCSSNDAGGSVASALPGTVAAASKRGPVDVSAMLLNRGQTGETTNSSSACDHHDGVASSGDGSSSEESEEPFRRDSALVAVLLKQDERRARATDTPLHSVGVTIVRMSSQQQSSRGFGPLGAPYLQKIDAPLNKTTKVAWLRLSACALPDDEGSEDGGMKGCFALAIAGRMDLCAPLTTHSPSSAVPASSQSMPAADQQQEAVGNVLSMLNVQPLYDEGGGAYSILVNQLLRRVMHVRWLGPAASSTVDAAAGSSTADAAAASSPSNGDGSSDASSSSSSFFPTLPLPIWHSVRSMACEAIGRRGDDNRPLITVAVATSQGVTTAVASIPPPLSVVPTSQSHCWHPSQSIVQPSSIGFYPLSEPRAVRLVRLPCSDEDEGGDGKENACVTPEDEGCVTLEESGCVTPEENACVTPENGGCVTPDEGGSDDGEPPTAHAEATFCHTVGQPEPAPSICRLLLAVTTDAPLLMSSPSSSMGDASAARGGLCAGSNVLSEEGALREVSTAVAHASLPGPTAAHNHASLMTAVATTRIASASDPSAANGGVPAASITPLFVSETVNEVATALRMSRHKGVGASFSTLPGRISGIDIGGGGGGGSSESSSRSSDGGDWIDVTSLQRQQQEQVQATALPSSLPSASSDALPQLLLPSPSASRPNWNLALGLLQQAAESTAATASLAGSGSSAICSIPGSSSYTAPVSLISSLSQSNAAFPEVSTARPTESTDVRDLLNVNVPAAAAAADAAAGNPASARGIPASASAATASVVNEAGSQVSPPAAGPALHLIPLRVIVQRPSPAAVAAASDLYPEHPSKPVTRLSIDTDAGAAASLTRAAHLPLPQAFALLRPDTLDVRMIDTTTASGAVGHTADTTTAAAATAAGFDGEDITLHALVGSMSSSTAALQPSSSMKSAAGGVPLALQQLELHLRRPKDDGEAVVRTADSISFQIPRPPHTQLSTTAAAEGPPANGQETRPLPVVAAASLLPGDSQLGRVAVVVAENGDSSGRVDTTAWRVSHHVLPLPSPPQQQLTVSGAAPSATNGVSMPSPSSSYHASAAPSSSSSSVPHPPPSSLSLAALKVEALAAAAEAQASAAQALAEVYASLKRATGNASGESSSAAEQGGEEISRLQAARLAAMDAMARARTAAQSLS